MNVVITAATIAKGPVTAGAVDGDQEGVPARLPGRDRQRGGAGVAAWVQ